MKSAPRPHGSLPAIHEQSSPVSVLLQSAKNAANVIDPE
jgi:hypothetical protein